MAQMILVMDNASYHHQINVNFYPKGKTPHTSSKGLNARVLRMAGCKAIKVTRGAVEYNYEVPDAEPPDWTAFLDGRAAPGAKPPTGGADGTVYARGGSGGPAARELAIAATQWFRAHRPEVLESKVETMFRELGWKIIWTPPYAPKYQPIELVWGVGKQRAGTLYTKGRTLLDTRTHLRWGWYGGGTTTRKFAPCNIRGCWETALKEMQKWIDNDMKYTQGKGVSGNLGALEGAERWTSSTPDVLDIKDMGTDDDLDVEDERPALEQNAALQADDVVVAALHLGGGDGDDDDAQMPEAEAGGS